MRGEPLHLYLCTIPVEAGQSQLSVAKLEKGNLGKDTLKFNLRMKVGPQWKEKCWSDARRQACSDTLPCMQKAGLLLLRASHTGCKGGGAGPAPLHAKNPGMCLQLAPARAIRSSKALCWSLLCNNKTSLMSLSSKPISLN